MTTTYQPAPKGMAIAALVLGILSMVIPLLGIVPAIAAIVLGIIALTRSASGRAGGKGMAIAGIVTGGLGVLLTPIVLIMVSILLPALSQAREAANRVKCAADMRQIVAALMSYEVSQPDGALPDSLSPLVASGQLPASAFVCPSTMDTTALGATLADQGKNLDTGGHDSYVYLGMGLRSSQMRQDIVVLYEPLSNHHNRGINVLFGDGHTEFLNRADAIQFLAAASNPQGPVYWPPRRP